MPSVIFTTQVPIVASDPNRVDIACFVGFVGRRDTPVSAEIQRWLEQQGWTSPPYGRAAAYPGVDGTVPTLEDLPIPLDSWDIFDYLFAWERRLLKFDLTLETLIFRSRLQPVPLLLWLLLILSRIQVLKDPRQVGTTYLGAAIRSFFAQGGRRCYLVRVGNPWAFTTSREKRLEQIAKLIPGYGQGVEGTFTGSPAERQGWHGVGHLFGLPDVSFLCLPDLPDAVSIELPPPDVRVSPRQTPEQFVECSEPEPLPPPDTPVRLLQTPQCDELGYREWARALNMVANLLARQQREVQLVAGVPIPQVGTTAEQNLWNFLNQLALSRSLNEDLGLSSAFLQLVYPWVRTPGSANLPKQLENPEAILVGILARNALTRGTFRSAANLNLADVYELFPVLSSAQILYRQQVEGKNTPQRSLGERLSFFGSTPQGLRLLSDVTTSLDENYRPASVNRLVSAIIRAARRLGEALVFEASGELLWGRLRESLNGLLLGLYQAGVLRGATPTEAFRVRCDRSTMTQNDIDAGRVIVEIQFAPTVPLERITVILAMSEGGQLVRIPTATITQEAV